jgi:hypothetical protein
LDHEPWTLDPRPSPLPNEFWMTLNQTITCSRWAGRIGAFLCILLFLIIIDALVSRFREPLNRFSVLPGSRIAVSGPLAEKTEQVRELTYQINSPAIQLEFETIQTGFWLGGYLWNGYLDISPRIQPGAYQLTVQPQKASSKNSSSLFQIDVYNDLRGLQKHSKCFLVRYVGIYPWKAGLFLIPFIVITFGIVFFLSYKTESLWAEQGKAEIYRVRKGETGHEIFFGLGRKQGIQPGSRLTLSNQKGKEIGSIFAEEVFESHSTAQVDFGVTIQPGFIVSKT